MDHFLFSSKRCNNVSRCELSSAHKQHAILEYVFHDVPGDPHLKRVVLTYLVEKIVTLQRWFCICCICSRAVGLMY